MIFTSIPEPRAVLAEMALLIPHLYAALENGTMKVREYFDHLDVAIDRDLAPEIVRYHARSFLDSVSEGLFSTERLARNGLYIRDFRDLEIRVFKSSDGELPVPRSKTREDYYQQLTLPVFEAAPALKLVVLWNVSYPYNLLPLTLACPRSGDIERMEADAHWYAPIPYPAQTASFDHTADSDPGLDKLVKPKKKPQTGTDGDSKKK
jgi:hypothetical protein